MYFCSWVSNKTEVGIGCGLLVFSRTSFEMSSDFFRVDKRCMMTSQFLMLVVNAESAVFNFLTIGSFSSFWLMVMLGIDADNSSSIFKLKY